MLLAVLASDTAHYAIDTTCEHANLSNDWHHIRIDAEEGGLATVGKIVLCHRLRGLASAKSRILPLRRLLDLCRTHRSVVSL